MTDPKTLVLSLDWSNRIIPYIQSTPSSNPHLDCPRLKIRFLTSASLLMCRCSRRSSSPSIITSLSNLSLAHLVPTSTGELAVESTWDAHEFEPWVASFDGWTPNVVYSGSSFSLSLLCALDSVQNDHLTPPPSPSDPAHLDPQPKKQAETTANSNHGTSDPQLHPAGPTNVSQPE